MAPLAQPAKYTPTLTLIADKVRHVAHCPACRDHYVFGKPGVHA